MKKCYFLAALLVPFVSLFAQTNPIPIFVDNELSVPFISLEGETVFVLPKGDRPIYQQYEELPYSLTLGGNQPMEVFQEGICVVRAKEGNFYWIDPSGKKVKDFGKTYFFIAPFQGGFALARKRVEGRNATELCYLNAQGENAFGEKAFWEAAPFSEGLAAVQTEENGPWGYIDGTGEQIVPVSTTGSTKIAELGPFSEGLARVAFHSIGDRSARTSVFINRTGEKVFAVKELFPERKEKRVGDFQEGMVDIALVRSSQTYDLAFVDQKGTLKKRYAKANRHVGFSQGRAYYQSATPAEGGGYRTKLYWLASTGPKSETEDLLEGIKVYSIHEQKHGLIEVETFERANWKEGWALLDAKTLQPVLMTEKDIFAFSDTHVLLRDKKAETYTLQTIEGAFIWGTPVGDSYFRSLTKALPHKTVVKRYELREPADFTNGLWQLTNLESLDIKYSSLTTVPAGIKKLENLTRITLWDNPNLTSLPKEMASLPNLEVLEITGCPRLTQGVAEIVRKAPALKTVRLGDVVLPDGFEAEIRAARPALEIDIYSTVGGMELESLDGGK